MCFLLTGGAARRLPIYRSRSVDTSACARQRDARPRRLWRRSTSSNLLLRTKVHWSLLGRAALFQPWDSAGPAVRWVALLDIFQFTVDRGVQFRTFATELSWSPPRKAGRVSRGSLSLSLSN